MGERIELYKIMVDTITANEKRRQQVNSVNISLLVAGMAALGGIKGLDPIYVALPAFPLAAIWLLSILYFRRLAKAKWDVVHDIESNFEHQPFYKEWRKLKEQSNYISFGLTHLEMFVPFAICLSSTLYLVFRLQQVVLSVCP